MGKNSLNSKFVLLHCYHSLIGVGIERGTLWYCLVSYCVQGTFFFSKRTRDPNPGAFLKLKKHKIFE